jgi:hypothetical protein
VATTVEPSCEATVSGSSASHVCFVPALLDSSVQQRWCTTTLDSCTKNRHTTSNDAKARSLRQTNTANTRRA